MKKAYIVLEDGMVFEGERFGAETNACGELVLSTGVCSHTEILTDPMNAGKIILSEFPESGALGVVSEDVESDISAGGFIVRGAPDKFRGRDELENFMLFRGICGVCGVDTRFISHYARAHGIERAGIFSEVPSVFPHKEKYYAKAAARDCATYSATGEMGERFFTVLIDCGTKASVVKALQRHGCKVRVVPAGTSAKDIISLCPDGVVISGGAEEALYEADLSAIKEVAGKIPMMGISLGHLLMAKVMGAEFSLLPFPAENVSVPVRELESRRMYIVRRESPHIVKNAQEIGKVIFENAGNGVCEGISYPEKLAFSVQFCPRCDTEFIYDRFADMMKGRE